MNTYNIKMEEKNDSNIFYEQILPLILTIVIFMSLGFILYVYILLLNKSSVSLHKI
jgi:hypothetical protein